MISLFFVLRGSRTNRTLIRATGEDLFLLMILAQLKSFCQQKMGKQKLREAIFSVRCSRRFFSRPLCGSKNAVNFLDHDGAKKGCNPSSPQERFTFVRHAVVSKVQKRYSLPKSNRNSLPYPDCRFLFLRLFLFDNSDAGQHLRCVIARFRATLRFF